MQKATGNSIYSNTYWAPSNLKVLDANGEYRLHIGAGLFCSESAPANKKICDYLGDIITAKTYQERDDAGYGGYALRINATTCLDCFNYKDYLCRASLANSPLKAWDPVKNKKAKANCKIKINTRSGEQGASLWTTRFIPANEEFLVSYHNQYVMPKSSS